MTVVALAIGLSWVVPTPAGAHGVGGIEPTNYRTTIRAIRPSVPGVTVRPVDLGERLELRNSSADVVTVLGYDGEPYLRLDSNGVFENRRSPTAFLNRTATPERVPPQRFDAEAPPDWHRTSPGDVARWHDHRAHWMGISDPAIVDEAPGRSHLIQRFELELIVDGAEVNVRGDVRWLPGPSPWPWLAAALGLTVAVVAASRVTRGWQHVLGLVALVAIVVQLVHLGGAYGATTQNWWGTTWAGGLSLAAVVVVAIGLARLLGPGPPPAIPWLVVGAMTLAFAGGLADLPSFWRSQLPTTFDADLARSLTVGVLGLSVGLFIAAAWRLRSSVAGRNQTSSSVDQPA